MPTRVYDMLIEPELGLRRTGFFASLLGGENVLRKDLKTSLVLSSVLASSAEGDAVLNCNTYQRCSLIQGEHDLNIP